MNISDAEPNFLSLWEEGSLCDVELRTADGALVPAHRIVLAAASPFFRALFVGSGRTMREGAEEGSVIDLPGVEEAELRVLLKAVYSNSAADIDARSVALLLAAASYLSVAAVREACARYLQTELSLSTAVETLALAERYDCADLRGDAVSSHYYIDHAKYIIYDIFFFTIIKAWPFSRVVLGQLVSY